MSISSANIGNSHNTRLAQLRITRGTGAISAALAMVVMVGWHIRNDALIQISPTFAPMQYNTALCFLLCGLGLVTLSLKRMHIAAMMGALAAGIGLITIVQYVFYIDVGIDRLSGLHYITTKTSHEGRMAPNTALCFLLSGAAIVLACKGEGLKHRVIMIELLGFTVLTLAVVALYGYLVDIELTYGWRNLTRMAMHTAIGFTLIGIGIKSYSWTQYEGHTASTRLWIPIVICLGGFLFDISISLGVAASIVYVPLVFCTTWFHRPSHVFIFATIGTLLICLGHYVTFIDVHNLEDLTNRGLSISMLWIVALLVFRQKKVQTKLSESEARLTSVIDNTVDGIITINERGMIESYNKACEQIFGYQAEEAIGQNINLLMPEPYHHEHDGYLEHYQRTGERKIIGIGREVEGKRKDGSIFPVDLSVSEITTQDKRFFSGIVRDISERKEAESAQAILIERLIRSNQELDDFAYIASHDLKEPLRGIANHANFLERDYATHLDEKGKHKIERITFLTQRMEALISDLLYYSRLGRTELATEKVNLNEVVREISETIQAAMDSDISIRVRDTLPTITYDKNKLSELFRNLITNGIKYNDSKEKIIEIGLQKNKGTPVYYVKDNGIGIEEKFHDDIFRIFKRLNKRDAYGGGTGSGLTFVKKIVERSGGKIWLESEKSKGTTFYFTLQEITGNDNSKN